jgi:tetratricopeptide (TPR) repeat protein
MGAFAEGLVVGAEALRLAEAVKHSYSIVVALNGVGLLYRRQGDLYHAIPVLERNLALCQEANIPLLVPQTAAFLGAAYALAGRTTEAIPLLARTLEQLPTVRRGAAHALTLAELSEALLLVGRVEDAHALAAELLDLSRTHPGRGYQAHALRLLGDVAMHRHPSAIELAEAYYRQALALAEALGMRPLVAHCHLGLGTLCGNTGRVAQARAELTAAIDLYRSIEMTYWLPQAEAALTRGRGEHGLL